MGVLKVLSQKNSGVSDDTKVLISIPDVKSEVSTRKINVTRILTIVCLIIIMVTVILFLVYKSPVSWLKHEEFLPEYCCVCDELKLSMEEENNLKINIRTSEGHRKCCVNTEEQYISIMKHMLSKQKIPSENDKIIATDRLNRLMTKNLTITLLHQSPVAAHMLIGTGLSDYQDNGRISDKKNRTQIRNMLQDRSLSLLRGVSMNRDRLIIQTKGLYLIYSQMYFKVIQGTNWPYGVKLLSHVVDRYNDRLPNDGEEELLQNIHTLVEKSNTSDPAFDFHTSYISGVFELNERDEVYARVTIHDVISRQPTLNFIGLVKIGEGSSSEGLRVARAGNVHNG